MHSLIVEVGTAFEDQRDIARKNSLLVTTCVAVGAIGFVGLRRRKQRKPTYQQSVDELLAAKEDGDHHWTLSEVDELPMREPLEQIEQEGLAEVEPWEREFGLPVGARGAKLRVVPGKTVKRAAPLMQERVVPAKRREMSLECPQFMYQGL